MFDRDGKAVHRLFGKWHESIYCGGASSSTCVWRASECPPGPRHGPDECLGQGRGAGRGECYSIALGYPLLVSRLAVLAICPVLVMLTVAS